MESILYMAEINPLLRNYVYVYTENSTCAIFRQVHLVGGIVHAEQFLGCLGAQITLYRNFGTVCVCGDFNARCGNLQDISLLCDTEIPPHKLLDVEQNSHVKQFIVTTGELVTKAEQKWLACSNRISRPLLRAEYQQLRQKFDSLIRKTKRKWSNRTWVFLDSSLQGGPQTFWNQLRKHTYWTGEEEVSQNPNGGH